jgi:aspartyl aminopeptidase
MSHILEDLKAFLDQSPTSWHAAAQIGNRLALQDFQPLSEEEKWKLEKGKKYFVSRGGSLCAFCLPSGGLKKMTLLASHTDSPSLKLKPRPEFQKENVSLFGVEVYGSPLLTSWLNRDLGIAGRIVVSDGKGKTEEKLVFIDDAPLVIPQLALHLDREVNEKGLVLNKQEHLAPIVGLDLEGKNALEMLLRRHHSFHKLLSFDLFLIPLEKSRFLGCQSDMIAAHRLDNLASAHACATALGYIEQPQPHHMPLCVFWDHEEIGSRTQEGAASSFLSDVLKRITLSLSIQEEEMLLVKNQSLCISVDVAHAFNPNYASKYDPNHQPLLGKGVALKFNADQKYITSAPTAAKIIQFCQELNLPLQNFACRSDLPCGSTVGPIVAQSLGIPTVDIGCPQLSMHSIREVIGCKDYIDLCALLTHALQKE